MHVIQYAFAPKGNCEDWFAEASAQWAEDYVYPAADEDRRASRPP
jgi:hypothetical protein